ncbi:M56 family metallopeptidase [Nodosilinea sp. LEGE 07088]|uniref:M56 family metallopeptidase n=1 Tax=Nodosilinea sp. LEGE 07088 TaxID=2777968 RepID=UPI00187E0F95|nr:M56 family metallopeptidase [Nodosilinea sp. LEGE 07088]MBE9136799.1 M56 family metallopeptidase [Nodosilinea sp. LEGE 07088]
MHSSLILLTLLLAVAWRQQWSGLQGRSPHRAWSARWESALSNFCLPPLMVLLVAGAVLSMGHHGTMLGWSVSPVGCWVSLGMLLFGSSVLAYSLGRAIATHLRLRQYPTIALPQGERARCVPIDLPMAAQVGLWRSSLLVSQGWLDQLTPHEQQAMLAHEQAHADYHDPLWFLGLGMLRRFAFWLPNTNALWEELLLLREIRADQQAASTRDPLLLAELLVKLARQMVLAMPSSALRTDIEPWVGFGDSLLLSRLEQRVNALITPDPMPKAHPAPWGRLAWLLAVALPLATTWLHT